MFEPIYFYEKEISTMDYNFVEKDTEYVIELNALGLEKSDINVKMKNNNSLIITGKKEVKEDNYLVHNFYPSTLDVVVNIPKDVNLENGINLKLENGILRIILKKNPIKSIKINFI